MTRLLNRTSNYIHKLVMLSVPLLICGLSQQIYTIINGHIIGKAFGTAGLSIVGGSASSLIAIMNNLINGFSVACLVNVSRFSFSEDEEGLSKAVKTSLSLAVGCGLLISVSATILGRKLLLVLSVPESLLSETTRYFTWYISGFVLYSLAIQLIAVLRGMNQYRLSSIYLIAAYLVNVLIDYGLYLLKAPLTIMAISYAISFGIIDIVIIFSNHRKFIRIMKKTRFSIDEARRNLSIAVPSAITMAIYPVANSMIQAKINSFGPVYIAAGSIYYKVEAIYWIFMSAISTSIISLVAKSGHDRISAILKSAMAVTFSVSCTITGLMYLFRNSLVGFLSDDTDVILAAVNIIEFMTLLYAFYPVCEVLTSMTKGIGKVKIPFAVTFLGICVVRIIWTYFVDLKTTNMVLFAYPLSWITTGTMLIAYWQYLRTKGGEIE